MSERPLPAYADLPVVQGAPPHSSWGLWGPHDQLGCLNLLSARQTAAACQDVGSGAVVALNASLTAFTPPLFGRPELRHDITSPASWAQDETLSAFNTQCSSQWDGFGHVRSRAYGFYNGLSAGEVSIATWARHGIAGRGVLLDLEHARNEAGRPFRHDTPDPIEVDELHAAATAQGITIRTGDILVLHTGWLDWARTSLGDTTSGFAAPGLRPGRNMLATLWDLHVAAVVSDTPAVEAWPPAAFATTEQRQAARQDPTALADIFMHTDLLGLLGLPLGELWDTGPLATACHRRGRWDFLLTSAPLNLPHGIASPSNAIAIL